MTKFKVLSAIKHDGTFHAEGAEVELPAEAAQILLDLGRIAEIQPAKPPKDAAGAKEGGTGKK